MRDTVHGGCVVVGEAGILIRGPSGSGKSALARRILAETRNPASFAGLVADDRVRLVAAHGRVLARPHPAIAGRTEVRGLGLLGVPVAAAAAVLRLVVDLADAPERLPDAPAEAVILGIALPRLVLPAGDPAGAAADLAWWLAGGGLAGGCGAAVTDVT